MKKAKAGEREAVAAWITKTFDPNQPRDDQGQWEDDGGSSGEGDRHPDMKREHDMKRDREEYAQLVNQLRKEPTHADRDKINARIDDLESRYPDADGSRAKLRSDAKLIEALLRHVNTHPPVDDGSITAAKERMKDMLYDYALDNAHQRIAQSWMEGTYPKPGDSMAFNPDMFKPTKPVSEWVHAPKPKPKP